MAGQNEPPKLPKMFADTPPQEHPTQWAKCWADGFTPWDRGGPSMALFDLLSENPGGVVPVPRPLGDGGDGPPHKKTALVPGCGRGHDVLLLSAFGYDVYGLDVSSQALDVARAHAETVLATDGRSGMDGRGERGGVAWICADFFAGGWDGAPASFDLIFDYRFFCALPPPRRPGWAARMKSLLSPGGRLVCLEFPAEKTMAEPGPPWAATPTEYLGYLSNPGGQPQTDEHGGVVVAGEIGAASGGLKRLVHIKPTRTHESGTNDGRVQDYISVWAHANE